VLLALFIAAIAVNLSRGRAPIVTVWATLLATAGLATLIRNMVFAMGAAALVWQGAAAIQVSTLRLSDALGGAQYFPFAAFLAMAAW